MKRTLLRFLFAVCFSSLAHAAQVGDRASDLTTTLGRPVAIRKKPDGAQVWRFKDGSTAWVEGGVVQRIAEPSAGNSTLRNGPAQLAASHAPEMTASPSPVVASTAMESRVVADIPTLSYVFVLAGLGVIVVTKIRFCILVFRTRGWRILGFFVPLVPLAFVFTRWKETKKLFAWQMLIALPLIMAGFQLTPDRTVPQPAVIRTGQSRAVSLYEPPFSPRRTQWC